MKTRYISNRSKGSDYNSIILIDTKLFKNNHKYWRGRGHKMGGPREGKERKMDCEMA